MKVAEIIGTLGIWWKHKWRLAIKPTLLCLFVITLGLTLVNSGCSLEQNQSLKSLRVGITSWAGFDIARYAQPSGIFKQRGLEVELVRFENQQDSSRAVLRGGLDAAFVSFWDVMQVDPGNDKPVVLMTTNISAGADGIVARPEIKSVEDLRGKKVGAKLGTVNHLILLEALKAHQIKPAEVQIRDLSNDVAAEKIKTGEIDAAVLWEPMLGETAKSYHRMEVMSQPSKNHLSHQLLIGFGISLATVGLTTLGLNYFLIQSKLELELEQRAQSITQGVGFSTEGLIELGNTSIIQRVVQNYATLPTVIEVAIVSPNGQTLARSGAELQNTPYASIYPDLAHVLKQSSQTGLEGSFRITIAGKPALVDILPFSSTLFAQSNRRGLAIAILDVQELQQQAWQTLSTSTIILLLGMSAILMLMTAMIQRYVLNPIQRLNKAVTDSHSIDHFVMPHSILSRVRVTKGGWK
ncbi:ABC transporter substrate-binding protein [Nostoc sp. FACHB-110]|uniref:ABC transporter substrate-binding protein n=1 Tax=Nostoc sp. FACHB-110 TaxID=2692834 RepID=UPI001681F2F3|nr:ABC transporter substrate-binding protein [Nostoc sp. FACHB-110]MBD2438450.1 ABC transporter substrate-binding protein [Nostoc sp. FACHB-110]